MSNTPNYNLKTWSTSEITDTFYNFLFGLAGDINSNMTKIDNQMKSSSDQIGATASYPVRRIFAEQSSESYYVATTSFTYAAYVSGNIFALTIDVDSSNTLTLNINSIGTMSIMKYKADGNIYNIAAGDIVANTINFIIFDGTQWILMNQIDAGLISEKTETTLSGLFKGVDGLVEAAVEGTDYDIDVVKYSEQTLDAGEKTQARTNIGAVGVSDIVNDVTTGGTTVPLAAEQGKYLKTLINAIKSGGYKQVQAGMISVSADAAGVTAQNITFGTKFSSIPIVLPVASTSAPQSRMAGVLSTTTTGATLEIYNALSAATISVYWLAVNIT